MLLAWSVSAQAAYYRYVGQLTSYSVEIPGYPNIESVLDPAFLSFEGSLDISQYTGSMIFTEAYYNVNFSDTSDPNRNAVVSFPHTIYTIGARYSFLDPLTGVVSGSANGYNTGATSFCVGSVTICAATYSYSRNFTFDLDLQLHPTLNTLTGTGVLTRTLANGTVITQEYAFSEIPLPAAAWLFGSGLIGLAGVVRQKRLATAH